MDNTCDRCCLGNATVQLINGECICQACAEEMIIDSYVEKGK